MSPGYDHVLCANCGHPRIFHCGDGDACEPPAIDSFEGPCKVACQKFVEPDPEE